MDDSKFQVNFEDFDRPRLDGVSGILRVMNDEKFLRSSIESSLSFLDELIIVYNETSKESIEIIQEMARKYPEKIKVYEYTPKLYVGELSEKDYLFVKSLPENSVHLLANYCNFALAKCSYNYVMKIDSDQIYFAKKMKLLVSRYKKKSEHKIKYSFTDFISFFVYILSAILIFKLRLLNATKVKTILEKLYKGYFRGTLFFIEKFKIPVSLSGVNLFLPKESNYSKIYIPLGNSHKNVSIPLPFNGIGDTAIFKLTSRTHFVPVKSSVRQNSIIERLQNVGSLLPVGVCWAHFSANREMSIQRLKKEFESCPSSFTALKIASLEVLNLFRYANSWDWYQANYYRLISPSLDKEFLVWLTKFFVANNEVRHKDLKL